jgi:hypothetical protein
MIQEQNWLHGAWCLLHYPRVKERKFTGGRFGSLATDILTVLAIRDHLLKPPRDDVPKCELEMLAQDFRLG